MRVEVLGGLERRLLVVGRQGADRRGNAGTGSEGDGGLRAATALRRAWCSPGAALDGEPTTASRLPDPFKEIVKLAYPMCREMVAAERRLRHSQL
jgi:hypothetical protein